MMRSKVSKIQCQGQSHQTRIRKAQSTKGFPLELLVFQDQSIGHLLSCRNTSWRCRMSTSPWDDSDPQVSENNKDEIHKAFDQTCEFIEKMDQLSYGACLPSTIHQTGSWSSQCRGVSCQVPPLTLHCCPLCWARHASHPEDCILHCALEPTDPGSSSSAASESWKRKWKWKSCRKFTPQNPGGNKETWQGSNWKGFNL